LFFIKENVYIDNWEEWFVFGAVCLSCVSIHVCTTKSSAPRMSVFWVFQIASFVMAMLWLYMLANIIVDLLVLFELISGFSAALLGLTVLSWGNSIGDAFASLAISRKGYGEMALTGCIAAPIFNILLGIGITTIRCNLKLPQGIVYDVDNFDSTARLTVSTLLASVLTLLVLIWFTVINNYKLSHRHAYVLIFIYSATVGMIVYEV
jgi:sodium/potassium/calcium exchanger 6